MADKTEPKKNFSLPIGTPLWAMDTDFLGDDEKTWDEENEEGDEWDEDDDLEEIF